MVSGRRRRERPAAQWRDFVRRFTCANDVTARDLQKRTGIHARKVVRSFLSGRDETRDRYRRVVASPRHARQRLKCVRTANTSQMIPMRFILEFISSGDDSDAGPI